MLSRVAVSTVLVIAAAVCGVVVGRWSVERQILAPQQIVTIVDQGLQFRARLDTGAVVSSINAHDIKVIGGGDKPSRSAVGKMISFVLINESGERREMLLEIAQVRGIRMADCREVRYHVNPKIGHRGRTYTVLTNLNDRSRAGDKFLLSRNWLHNGFAVGAIEESEI